MTEKRIVFSKSGALIYISHLDLNHAFIRAIARAGLKLVHSQGFNPHPKIVFALPLSVGAYGECEMADITLENDISSQELFAKLVSVMPKGIEILEVREPDIKFKKVKSALYTAEIFSNLDVSEKIRALLSNPLVVTKKSKSGQRDVDISPMIEEFDISYGGEKTVLKMTLSSSSELYLNPEYVIGAIFERVFLQNLQYTLTRNKIIFDKEA